MTECVNQTNLCARCMSTNARDGIRNGNRESPGLLDLGSHIILFRRDGAQKGHNEVGELYVS